MKRTVYTITLNGQPFTTRYAWKACLRAIESHVRAVAKGEAAQYHLTASESHKPADEYRFKHGSRTWQGDNSGMLHFTITREEG